MDPFELKKKNEIKEKNNGQDNILVDSRRERLMKILTNKRIKINTEKNPANNYITGIFKQIE